MYAVCRTTRRAPIIDFGGRVGVVSEAGRQFCYLATFETVGGVIRGWHGGRNRELDYVVLESE